MKSFLTNETVEYEIDTRRLSFNSLIKTSEVKLIHIRVRYS